MTFSFHWLTGSATVKNVSGDTVIGKLTQWHLLPAGLNKPPEVSFVLADGSNSFLKVSSHSGGIDVYVGDGGSADLDTQEGKNTLLKIPPNKQHHVFSCVQVCWVILLGLTCSFNGYRRGVCACPILTKSWGGAQWSVSKNQPRGCCAERKIHNSGPNHSYWLVIILHYKILDVIKSSDK